MVGMALLIWAVWEDIKKLGNWQSGKFEIVISNLLIRLPAGQVSKFQHYTDPCSAKSGDFFVLLRLCPTTVWLLITTQINSQADTSSFDIR